jgi:prophage regulatory protein
VPHNPLPTTGFVRLHSILAPRGPIPVCKSSWWDGIRRGRFPRPIKLGPRTTAWRVEDIRALIEHPGAPFSTAPQSSGGVRHG